MTPRRTSGGGADAADNAPAYLPAHERCLNPLTLATQDCVCKCTVLNTTAATALLLLELGGTDHPHPHSGVRAQLECQCGGGGGRLPAGVGGTEHAP